MVVNCTNRTTPCDTDTVAALSLVVAAWRMHAVTRLRLIDMSIGMWGAPKEVDLGRVGDVGGAHVWLCGVRANGNSASRD